MTSIPQTEPDHQNTDTDTDTEIVLGVDTHRDTHACAVLTALGATLAVATFPATAAGYQQVLAWAGGFGRLRRAGVECTGSYGAALTRTLLTQEVEVFEVNQPDKGNRRRRGKTDLIDAEAAARAVISGRATAIAKTSDGVVEAVRLLKLARDSAINASTKAINQLRSVIVGASPQLRESMTGLGLKTLIRHCAALSDLDSDASIVDQTVICTLRLLAQRVTSLKAEAHQLEKLIRAHLNTYAPQLLERVGIGPDSAAALLITAGDNPDRIHAEASYAALCGASPVESSSGNSRRLRLNRGGDRQANAALYRIVQSRLRFDEPTQQYLQRRLAEGKTRKEIIRCLKRYVAREVFGLIHSNLACKSPALAT